MGDSRAQSDAYFALEVPDDALIGSIAHEAALTDAALAGLTVELGRADRASADAASLALTLGRAGWRPAARCIAEREAVAKAQSNPQARIYALAQALLHLRPSAEVEAAEVGYRFCDELGVLYVEDPIAAHWHHAGRWGPPIRPDLRRSGRHASGPGRHERLVRWAADGGVVVVTFQPRGMSRPEPPLRLCKAGFARDVSFGDCVRWSSLRSMGRLVMDHGEVAAVQIRGEAPTSFPVHPSVPTDDLLVLMETLSAMGRGTASATGA